MAKLSPDESGGRFSSIPILWRRVCQKELKPLSSNTKDIITINGYVRYAVQAPKTYLKLHQITTSGTAYDALSNSRLKLFGVHAASGNRCHKEVGLVAVVVFIDFLVIVDF